MNAGRTDLIETINFKFGIYSLMKHTSIHIHLYPQIHNCKRGNNVNGIPMSNRLTSIRTAKCTPIWSLKDTVRVIYL